MIYCVWWLNWRNKMKFKTIFLIFAWVRTTRGDFHRTDVKTFFRSFSHFSMKYIRENPLCNHIFLLTSVRLFMIAWITIVFFLYRERERIKSEKNAGWEENIFEVSLQSRRKRSIELTGGYRFRTRKKFKCVSLRLVKVLQNTFISQEDKNLIMNLIEEF